MPRVASISGDKRRRAIAIAKRSFTLAERQKVYDVMATHGPDVDMWTPRFGRLVGQAKKAGVLGNRFQLYKWLDRKGMFGPASDRLRSSGDRYWP